MLLLNNSKEANEAAKNLEENEKYSRINVNKFEPERGIIGTILKFISDTIVLCDLFKVKPNLSGSKYSSSLFGCLLTLLIIILAILTFALTLHNMSVSKVYME